MESYREAPPAQTQWEQGDTLQTDRILHAYYLADVPLGAMTSVHRAGAQQKDANEPSLSGKLLMPEMQFHFQGSKPQLFQVSVGRIVLSYP